MNAKLRDMSHCVEQVQYAIFFSHLQVRLTLLFCSGYDSLFKFQFLKCCFECRSTLSNHVFIVPLDDENASGNRLDW